MNIAYSNQAQHFLRSHPEIARRLFERIELLALRPYEGSRRVHGSTGIHRVRVGDIRILYEIDEKEQTLGIIRIARRENAYD